MALRICAWMTLIAFTAIVPGGVAGILAGGRRWTPPYCARVARVGGWGILASVASIAFLMGSQNREWVVEPFAPAMSLAVKLAWAMAADTGARYIARRIAFPNLKA